eukprot:764205-Hanusia_phi.AAC.4
MDVNAERFCSVEFRDFSFETTSSGFKKAFKLSPAQKAYLDRMGTQAWSRMSTPRAHGDFLLANVNDVRGRLMDLS